MYIRIHDICYTFTTRNEWFTRNDLATFVRGTWNLHNWEKTALRSLKSTINPNLFLLDTCFCHTIPEASGTAAEKYLTYKSDYDNFQ